MIGFLNVYKPIGQTSSDAVVKIRRRLIGLTGDKKIKVGHFGTLDPAAEGVLVVAVGNAVKLFDYFLDKKKVYRAEFTFGKTTDTLDREGVVTAEGGSIPTSEELVKAAEGLTGEVYQMPPLYSAKSVGGKKAYQMARDGEEFELSPKKVTINSIKLLSQEGKKAEFLIETLGGVYIRSIARDMAEACGTHGYMSALVRTQVGAFKIEEALPPDRNVPVLPLEYALTDFETYNVHPEQESQVINGVMIKVTRRTFTKYLVVKMRGKIFGMGENIDGLLKVKTRF